MARRITVKKVLSSIPNITKLTGFSDVNDSGLSGTNGFLRYDSDNQNFKFVSLADLGVQSVNSITGAVTITGASGVSVNTSGDTITLTGAVDSASVNTLIDAADTHDSAAVQAQIDSNLNALDTHDSAAVQGQITSTINASYINALTIDADTLAGNDSAYYLNYNNFTNTPTIPTVDSASIQPLARAAISAGNNVTYDSATGIIGTVGTDSATVVSIADSRISAASIGDLSNVDLTGIVDGRILKYNASSGKFIIAADATDSGGGVTTADLVVIDSSVFGSLSYNGGSGVFSYVGVDSDDIKTVTNIPYANLTGTPTIPTVDSATIRPLARAAIVAGTNITYDSATGVIASTASGGEDHDSAKTQAQIDSTVTIAFINSLTGTLNADTLGGNDSTYYLNYNNFTNTPTIPTVDSATVQPLARAAIVAGANITYDSGTGIIASIASGTVDSAAVNVLIAAADTHDSVAVQGQIDSNLNALDTHDSALIQAQIDSNFTNDTTFVRVAGDQVTGNIQFVDNVQARFGVGGTDPYDFRIYSTGTSNRIEAGEIDTLTVAAGTLFFTDANLLTTLQINATSSTDLYYNKVKVAETTSTGMSMNRLAADSSVTVGGNEVLTTASDTHDSAAVLGQINGTVNRDYIVSAIEFEDEEFLTFGDDSDFTITHNGNHTVLKDKGAGSLFIEGSQIHLASQNNGNPIFLTTGDGDGVKIFDSSGDLRLNTTDAGVSVFAGLKLDGNDVLTTASTIDADTLGTISSTSFLRSDVKDQKTAGSLVMNDGVAIKFGTDSDHTIKEMSGNLEVNTAGSGLLKMNTAGLRIHNEAGTENMILASQNDAVTLYFDGNQKAVTRSDGFEVTGHLITDSIQTTHIDIFGEITNRPTSVNAGSGQTIVKQVPHFNLACSITYNIHMFDINGTTTKGETSFTTVACTLDSDLNTAYTEFATLFTGDSEFGFFDVDADSTNINLKFTRRSTRDGVIRVAAAKTIYQ